MSVPKSLFPKMAERRAGLRPVLRIRLANPAPKTNAQRCAEYVDRLRADPDRFEEHLHVKKVASKVWREKRSSDQRHLDKENARLRQQKRRLRLKEEKLAELVKTPPPCQPVYTPKTRRETRADDEKMLKSRADARERQRKRRAGMTSQKKRRENEKRKERYQRQKQETRLAKDSSLLKDHAEKRPARLLSILRKALQHLKPKRDRRSLDRLQQIKELLAKNVTSPSRHFYPKHQRSDTSVEDFFERNSIDLPGKSTVSSVSMKQKRVLTKKLDALHKEYLKERPGAKMSFATFARRRPKHVLLAGSRAFLQCLCEFCVNPMLKMEKLNKLLPQNRRIFSVEDLVQKTLCPDMDYSRKCVDRCCGQCGVGSFIKDMEEQLVVGTPVTWLRWEKSERSPKEQIEKSGTTQDMLQELHKELDGLAIHVKTASWQRKQYQDLLGALPEDTAVLTVDFAENYLCRYQNEVQSAHWSYRQVSVHPCVLHYNCRDGCGKVVTEYLVFVSDDLRHDANFTKHVFNQVISRMAAQGVKNLHIFSDGCGAQYKSKLPFVHLTDLARTVPQVKLHRHFFGSHHGKSLCDSCGGVVKNAATRAVNSGRCTIQSASQFHAFCKENLTITPVEGKCDTMLRSFVLVQPQEIAREEASDQLRTMPGTRKLHSLMPCQVTRGRMKRRTLSCFCDNCLAGRPDACNTVAFTGVWVSCQVEEVAKKRKPTQRRTTKPLSCCPAPPPAHRSPSPAPSPPSSPSPSPSITPDPMQFRENFFKEAQCAIDRAASFPILRDLCAALHEHLVNYPVRAGELEKFEPDVTAAALMPGQLHQDFIPVSVRGDGNCFFRSLSFLATGSEDHHLEFRIRVTVDMALNEDQYTSKQYLETSSGSTDIFTFLALFAAAPFDAAALTDAARRTDVYHEEVMAVRQTGAFCGVWQLFSAANVLQSTMQSVYPEKGEEPVWMMMNRTFHPASGSSSDSHAVMWTSNRKDMPAAFWVANHVVPLLPYSTDATGDADNSELNRGFCEENGEELDNSFELDNAFCYGPEPPGPCTHDASAKRTVCVEEFYPVRWTDGDRYICQVKEVDWESSQARVHFMQRVGKGDLFTWPLTPDSSWEPLSLFKSPPVSLVLVEDKSSHRKQFYKFV